MLEHLLYIEEMENRRPYCTDLVKYLKNGFNRDKYRTVFGSWTAALEKYDAFKVAREIKEPTSGRADLMEWVPFCS
ncbi:hypothetical protein M3182_00675 [Mesobacillus maritimus]|uniref:hypothetical protein n=1 Tax=Mesobacillus maritimus TaxID=1643336 RepID=UPI00203D09F1|nr:hypothetical protein [Mesobacillus maritimus]MCM3584253.1 hypothetical protein [Mesobacillus maritimus]